MNQTATVLLVDDEAGLADTAAAFVERTDEALTTTTATSADAGLDRLDERDVDCVVSDYDMPEKNGFDMFEAVRERNDELPFILFTGKGSEEVASEALSLGVTDYLQKETGIEQYEVLANRVVNAIEAQRAEEQLEHSEERYQHLVDSAPAGILITRLDDTVVYANDAAASFIGADDPADLIGVSTLGFVHPEDETALRERWQGSREGEAQEPVEERFVGFDGETRHAVVASTPVTYEGEDAVQSVLTDITEQRRAEAALREEREFTERALDALDDLFYVLDEDGELRRWNHRVTAVTGYSDEEIAAMDPTELFVEGDRGRVAETISAVVETGHASVEATLETKDGERLPHEFVGSKLAIDGETVGVCAIGRDIADRRERERELEGYRTMVEAAPVGVYVLDADATIRRCNEQAAALVGRTATDLVGTPFSALIEDGPVPEEADAAYETAVRDLLSSESDRTTRSYDVTVTPSGGDREVRVHVSLLPYDEAFRGTVLINEDITEHRAHEREGETTKRLLERQNKRLEAFASTVSHDLRSPLTVASGRLELLADDHDSPHVQPIREALSRMNALIEESVALARAGMAVTEPMSVDPARVAETAWRTVETGDTDLCVGDLGTVAADDERLGTLFENLFRNAVEHGDAATVRVGPLDGEHGFYVADDGSGIPETEREAVFDRGYSTTDGTGLGLALVETIAEAHGWRVELGDGSSGARFEVAYDPPSHQRVARPAE